MGANNSGGGGELIPGIRQIAVVREGTTGRRGQKVRRARVPTAGVGYQSVREATVPTEGGVVGGSFGATGADRLGVCDRRPHDGGGVEEVLLQEHRCPGALRGGGRGGQTRAGGSQGTPHCFRTKI